MRQEKFDKFTPINQLDPNDPTYQEVLKKWGEDALNFNLTQLRSHYDIEDPRTLAAHKATGRVSAEGGTGPKQS